MPRYCVTLTATLKIEVDAPRPQAAIGSLQTAFDKSNGTDPLQGTRFTFGTRETECSNPRLVTCEVDPDDWAEAEEVN